MSIDVSIILRYGYMLCCFYIMIFGEHVETSGSSTLLLVFRRYQSRQQQRYPRPPSLACFGPPAVNDILFVFVRPAPYEIRYSFLNYIIFSVSVRPAQYETRH